MLNLEKLKALAEAQPVKEWSRREAGMSSYARKPMFVVDGPEAVSDYESWGFTRAAASYIEAASPAAVLELIAEVEHARLVRFLHGEKATLHWRRLEEDRNGLVAALERVRDQLKAAGAEGATESDMRQGLCAALALAEQALPVLPAPPLTSRLREKLQAMQKSAGDAGDAGGSDRG